MSMPWRTLAAAAILVAASTTTAADLIDCLAGGTIADRVDRGFYVPDYPGTSLSSVDLVFSANTAGDYTIRMTVRAGTYDGTVLGTADLVVSLSSDPYELFPGRFEFPSPAITAHSTVTFAMEQLDGPGTAFYGISPSEPSCPVIETNGTTPPLDTIRNEGIRVLIQGEEITPAGSVGWGALKAVYR